LLTHIAMTESVSLCERMKKLTAFVELERAICVSLLFLPPCRLRGAAAWSTAAPTENQNK
jgi:hypothetical protein